MKRLVCVLSVCLVGFFMAGAAEASLSRGDQTKLRRWLSEYLDRSLAQGKRDEALASISSFFADKKKSKELAEIKDFTEILAQCAKRPNQRAGVATKEVALADLGINSKVKYKYVVSIPKKYSGTAEADSWPLILCLPDRGQSAQAYMDKFWTDAAVRDEYVIAVLEFDYADIEVEVTKNSVDEDGNVTMEHVKEKVPFSWDSDAALAQFWWTTSVILTREFKINPDRVILAGAGFGGDGAISFAVSQPWRFGGLVNQGGEFSGPLLQNLASLRTLNLGSDGDSDGAKNTNEEIKKHAGENFSEGTADQKGWLDGSARSRYPLPSKWVVLNRAQEIGYWFFISKIFDPAQPALMSISSDPKKKRVDVTAENVGEFTVYLNDILIDMDKPFDLYVNGELKREGVVAERSADLLLGFLLTDAPGDPGVVFTSKIADIRLAAPAPKEADKKPEEGEKKPEDK